MFELNRREQQTLHAVSLLSESGYATSPRTLARWLGWPDLETAHRLETLRQHGLISAAGRRKRHAVSARGRRYVQTVRVDLEAIEDLARLAVRK